MVLDEFGRHTQIERISWRERHTGKLLLAVGSFLLASAAVFAFSLDGEHDDTDSSTTPTTRLAPETPLMPQTTTTQQAPPTEATVAKTSQLETTTTINSEVAKCLADYETDERAFQRKIAIDSARRAYAEQHEGRQPDNPNFEFQVLRDACLYNVKMGSGTHIR